MKHNYKITILLLSMFLVAQFIGLAVINAYTPQIEQGFDEVGNPINVTTNQLPYGMQPPEIDARPGLISIIISFVIAITLILILSKYKWKFLIRAWFFVVVAIALGLALNAFIGYTSFQNSAIISLILALPLAFIKVYKSNFLIHNATELFIYPGIAAVFVPILSVWTIIILLILISLYDMWAVWQSGIMQKMAKFQIQELNIFGGFFIPTASKSVKSKIRALRKKYKGKTMPKSVRNKKFRVNLAILGGGDVVFPIITAGVFLRTLGLVPALFVIAGAFAGLTYLFLTSNKKAYPAMPYITAGIFLGIGLWWLVGLV